MLKLPTLEELENMSEKKTRVINKHIDSTEKILNQVMLNIEAFKKIEADNKRLRGLLLENQNLLKREIYDKLKAMSLELKDKQEKAEKRYKALLKEQEKHKLNLKEQLEMEKSKSMLIMKKHKQFVIEFAKVQEENESLKKVNKKLSRKVNFLNKQSLANTQELNRRTQLIQEEHDRKAKNIAKKYLDKEIEYKSKIESLTKDLGKYMQELKEQKQKYYNREKELKEKLKEFL